jgi:hypothetical protein
VEKELGGDGHGERRAAKLTGCAGSAWAANGRRGEGEWRLREKPARAQCHLDRRMHGWARGVSMAPRRMALALYRSVRALPGLGASAYDLRSFPRRMWSIAKTPRRPYAGVKRGSHVAGAVQTRWARRRRRPSQVLFRLSLFKIAKLQKSSTNSKIFKKQSCRGAIDLQLSRKATYVLINRLPENVGRSWQKSRPQVTVHSAFNSIFGQFALKIGMSANYEKCVPGNNEQLSYWPIELL